MSISRIFLFVSDPDADAIELTTDVATKAIDEAVVDVGVEGWHDFARIATDLFLRDLARHIVRFDVRLHRLDHFGIEYEAVDQHAALG